MNMKKYFILIAFYLCSAIPASFGMDRPLQSNLSLEEECLKTLSELSPQAVRIIADDVIARNRGISGLELLDFYTVKRDGDRYLAKAMLPMIKAIWQEIRTVRLESLKKSMFDSKCVFRSPPRELAKVIESLKKRAQHPQTLPTIRALMIVDPDLIFTNREICRSREIEAQQRACLYFNLIAEQSALQLESFKMCNCQADQRLAEISGTAPRVLYLIHTPCCTCNNLLSPNRYFEILDKLMNGKHFVIMTSVNANVVNYLKNREGIMVIFPTRQTLNDRLVTLKDLAIKHNCPPEIVQNLEVINQIIPEEVTIPNSSTQAPLSFDLLDSIMSEACEIFLTDGKFDKNKAHNFFKRDWFSERDAIC